ncbi:MAG TPA: hypothetical protein VK172_09905 [Lentimicrobium sp.]|nr:hypothetical protein [Lentimicrobium sp.]
MKRIITFCLLLAGITANAQDSHNLINNFFKDRNNILNWQIIRETNLSRTQMIDAIIETGLYDKVDVTENSIVCEFKPYKVNYEQYGFSIFESSTVVSTNLVTATVIFELKAERYRTTVKNIRFIQNTDSASGMVTTIEDESLTRQQDIRFSILKNTTKVLDKDFTAKTALIKQSEEW